MTSLFHIVDPDVWAAAVAAGTYRAPSLDTEGFIHCSYDEQVGATLQRHYAGVAGLVVVELDPSRIGAPVRVEFSEPAGDSFPHVYGPIATDAALAVHPAARWVSDPGGPAGAASPDR